MKKRVEAMHYLYRVRILHSVALEYILETDFHSKLLKMV